MGGQGGGAMPLKNIKVGKTARQAAKMTSLIFLIPATSHTFQLPDQLKELLSDKDRVTGLPCSPKTTF